MAGNKSRLLRLYRYLYLNTDEKHYTTKQEIMDAVREEGEVYSRQTVRDDIDTLSKEGYDIETVVSSGNYYYFRDREFTLDELKMMSDAVASYRFIGKKQKAALIGKLKKFCSRFQAGSIERHLVSIEPQESGDARIYEAVNTVNDALNQGKRISFQYREEGGGPDRRQFSEGEEEGRGVPGEEGHYIASPFDLVWDGRSFYLLAGVEDGCGPLLFELRRMTRLLILEQGAAQRPAGLKTEKIARDMLGDRAGK